MAGRTRKTARQFLSEAVIQPVEGSRVSSYRPGDLLLVKLGSETAESLPSVWIRVDHCDDQRRIVYGTIDGSSVGLGKALSLGARLAVGYHMVSKNACVVSSEASCLENSRS